MYKEGWRGVNIEPGEKNFSLLKEVRPEDVTLKVGLGKASGKAIFYEMDVDSLSTFNKEEALKNQYNKRITSAHEVQVLALSDIFISYFKGGQCDFLSIDVEGNNLEVLEGNDWRRFRPSYIMIEMPGIERLKIIPYLYQNGYYLIFDNSLNGIFKNSGEPQLQLRPINFEQCLSPP